MDSPLTKLKRLIAELEDAHQGEGNDITFEAWLRQMADNVNGTLRAPACALFVILAYHEELE